MGWTVCGLEATVRTLVLSELSLVRNENDEKGLTSGCELDEELIRLPLSCIWGESKTGAGNSKRFGSSTLGGWNCPGWR